MRRALGLASGLTAVPGLAAAAAPAIDVGAASSEPAFAAYFLEGVRRGAEGVPHIPALGRELAAAWTRDTAAMSGDILSGGTGFGPILAVPAAGLLCAILLYLLLRRLARRKLAEHHDDFAGRLRVSGLQLLIDGLAIGCFGLVAALAVWRLLPPEGFVRSLAEAGLVVLLAFGGYLAGGRFLLSPGRPGRRLMPLPHAAAHFRALAAYGLLGPIFTQSLPVLCAIEADAPGVPGWFFVAATLINLFKVAWFWLGRHDIAALMATRGSDAGQEPRHAPGLIRRIAAQTLPWFYIAVAIAIWVITMIGLGSPAGLRWAMPAGLTQILTVLLPIAATGTAVLGTALSRRIHGEAVDPAKRAAAAAICTLSSGAIWVASLAILVRLWGEYLVDPASGEAAAALRAVTRTGAAIVLGWTIWTLAKTYFDAAAPKTHGLMPGQDDEGTMHAASRLATALPLVRNLVLGAVLAVTALVILSSLGVEIGPFLAGFGVLGLAISFGSQALVRDIVSGIFFMADDAFRVGEYIDTGRLKGTVEKITLRSVQLRHQNGQIHNIPFGQIQSTTNFSRDWTTVKFPLRLDREADVEKARKAIKKVGEQMMAEPDFASELIQPLKMQGIQDITDTAIVIRCKFTCRPFKPTWLQREALKRIHRALSEAGVEFASNAVTFRDPAQGGANAGAAASMAPVRAAAE